MEYLNVDGGMFEPRQLYAHLMRGMPESQKRSIAIGLERQHYTATKIAWMISRNAAEEFGGKPNDYQITGEPLKEAQVILSITVRSFKTDVGWRDYSLEVIAKMRDALWENAEEVSMQKYKRHTGSTAGLQKLLSRVVHSLQTYRFVNGQLAIDSAGYVWVWRKRSQLKFARTEEEFFQSGETTNELHGHGQYRTRDGRLVVRGLSEFEDSVVALLSFYYGHRAQIDKALVIERDRGALL